MSSCYQWIPSVTAMCLAFSQAVVASETSPLIAGQKNSSPGNHNSSAAQKNSWPMFDPNSLKESNELWIEGDVLFWQSNLGSLSYGTQSDSPSSIQNAEIKNLHFDWDWGFRLGLGYKLPYDKWDLFVNYTYLKGYAHGHSSSADDVIFPNWASGLNFAGSGSFYAQTAKAHWRLSLNMADLELGRNCFVGKWLTIRPFLGLRGLVINQTYHVAYQGGSVAPSDTDKIHLNTDFWGVGIRMGFNSLWGLGKGFGIYGNGSAALLSGHFKVTEDEKLIEADERIFTLSNHNSNVVVTADLALGIQWDYLFSKDRYHFGVKFGWEFNMFFNQNQLFNFLDPANPSSLRSQDDDLAFQGITLGLRFDF